MSQTVPGEKAKMKATNSKQHTQFVGHTGNKSLERQREAGAVLSLRVGKNALDSARLLLVASLPTGKKVASR